MAADLKEAWSGFIWAAKSADLARTARERNVDPLPALREAKEAAELALAEITLAIAETQTPATQP